ncbi:hypothetical protein A3F00_02125 [Candidatus Daviesbacteria bacterium RIFCSPHIGHO2_12_FULL_37_11]|uniref:Class F sortase n=1 Tax=Candidatus Daviesbacteria bacterium RIFCSPHIGHO2_12_FULL_37_11 TaxID=1797777 RepID=A0A1F5KAK4_9BACT|nr:MAG: hypothetical protein A2111_01830 [Candidatus Daviesbacteria bacterium GWA1_38_6]OGE18233.1 MAG: hypothetical protein A2769_00295 [Candidatus Daviesbacteria bacterium RIFCSPHIGHO2_01_FULL_37_27]OGE37976.1 MAG: hypothetical protein A3F00_02125 [Candidatus Daviesbacteria bacterium RIFCSPHIGHO2_12_FULL_37_11]OGE46184.1 MAG: hypothetical protein A3B39_04490 [Candidatus Daviesbacteria bacterium RIFCSPLOWO2_01_FULL_37_10]
MKGLIIFILIIVSVGLTWFIQFKGDFLASVILKKASPPPGIVYSTIEEDSNQNVNYLSQVNPSDFGSTASSTADIGIPVKISIPKLKIEASVEQVGLDTKGRMDVPKRFDNIGWYNLGFRPGQNGSAVLSGHLDTVSGKPAVFYNLSKLTKDDEISITDGEGKILKFRVYNIESYPFNQFPLHEVFATTGRPLLNLITCSGNFNKLTRNYTNRTVVYAEIID